MATYYVYLYSDPRMNPPVPIYVGLGHGKRFLQHTRETHNDFLRGKIAGIRKMGLEPIVIKVFEGLTAEEARQKERELISLYGRSDLNLGSLCNFTDGGEGTQGFKHRPETRSLFSLQRKGKAQTKAQYEANCNRQPTDEARKRISEATKGHHWHTPEQIEAIKRHNSTRVISDKTRKIWSEQRKGKKQTPEHIRKVKEAKARANAKRQETMSPEEWAAYKDQSASKVRGQKRSEETKAKMRAAWVRRKMCGKIDARSS